jgi:type I restriction enzyme S subunit
MKLKPYPAYKDSGVEWLGDVPEEWATNRLKRVSEVFASNVDKKSVDGEIEVRLCNYTDVYYKDEITNDLELMKATATEAQIDRFTLRKDDVIITKDSESADDIGISAYVPHDMPGVICGYHLSMIRSREDFNGKYIKRLFDSHYVRSKLEISAQGLTRVGLGQYVIDNLDIPVPTHREQTTISTFLDRETAKLDTLISNQERLIELLQERIIATVSNALVSEESHQIRLSHVCDVISRPVIQNPEESYVRLGLLNRGRGIFKRDETDSDDMGDSDFFWVEKGDLIISGQFAWEGAVALADEEHSGCVVSHRFPVIRGKEGIVLTEYLFALFMTPFGDFILNENSRGSAGRNRPLNLGLLLKEKIPIPPLALQSEVAKLIHLKKQLVDKSKSQISFVQEHRSALISAAVTGKIDVREAA